MSYANVTATLALFFALCGTAWAAHRYLVTSTSQIKPSVLRKLHGAKGTNGADGATGPSGATGATGPLLTTLPSGKAETGSFGAAATAGAAGSITWASISFPLPLASAPSPNYIAVGGSPTTNCPGSVTAPSAASGQLCVYFSFLTGTVYDIFNPATGGNGDSVNGANVALESTASGGFGGEGTWAITAP